MTLSAVLRNRAWGGDDGVVDKTSRAPHAIVDGNGVSHTKSVSGNHITVKL